MTQRVDTVNTRPYHHGDLRSALVRSGVQLAREGGPGAIVLREAARRIGVSPAAAYRHFASLPDLVEVVARFGADLLASGMDAELAGVPPSGDASLDAVARLRAVGRSYVRFALAEPGLFATYFGRGVHPYDVVGSPGDVTTPATIMRAALDDLVAARLLAPEEVAQAFLFAWSTVHGLSTLLVGASRAVLPQDLDASIDAVLSRALGGLVRPYPSLPGRRHAAGAPPRVAGGPDPDHRERSALRASATGAGEPPGW